MHHIISRHQLLEWVANNAPNKIVRLAIDRGKVTIHGLFVGGWVVEAKYLGQSYVVGIKPVGIGDRLICGLLKRVPVGDYVGGDTPINVGDKDGSV